MKHKRLVSMVGALILIISAVVLINGCSQGNGGNNTSINGVWRLTTPLSQSSLEEGFTDIYLAFDGQMHIYAYRKRGVLYKGASCTYIISGDVINFAGRESGKFSINNNILTVEGYRGSWAKVNTPTLAEIQNALNAPD